MNIKKLLQNSLFVFCTALISWGCKKDFLSSLSNNPNAPTTSVATPKLILPGTITNLVSIDNGYGAYQSEAIWLGYWNIQPGYSFNSAVADYVLTSDNPQLWDAYYDNLTNLNVIEQQTAGDATNTNYHDIANILEVMCFQQLVDLYNDIPYSQALKGNGDFYPSYDKGSDVYDSLTARLDDAMASISANLTNANAVLPTTDDVMFGGDMQSWLVFANTVKLRLLLRESNVTSKLSYLSSEVAKTSAYGYLTSDALVNPGYSSSKPNTIWGNLGYGPSGALNTGATYISANSTAISFYVNTQDPRLGYFYTANGVAATSPGYFNVTLPIDYTDYYANPLGIQKSNPSGAGSSNIGSGIVKSPDQGGVMISAAESYFLQAEATIYGWLPGGATAAKTLYQDGITASYEYLNVGGSTAAADAAAMAYYNQDVSFVSFPVTASVDSLDHTILEQKWAALNGISIVEPYDDWRRTYDASINSGYPLVPVSADLANTNPHMPFRYFYPTEEKNNNNAAWAAAGGATINVFTDKIFWMK